MNDRWTRRDFLKTGAVGAAGFLAAFQAGGADPEFDHPGEPISRTYPETTTQLKIANPSRFTILQITDAHLRQKREDVPDGDQRSFDDWNRMVDTFSPDLIAVTGDFWHNNPDGRGQEYMADGVEQVSGIGLPWTFCWGNHDLLDDYKLGHDTFHDAKGSLYCGGPGGGNYTVDVLDSAGKSVWELICLNTHIGGLVGPSYNWLEKLAKSREKAEGETPAFVLMHIPVRQYMQVRSEGDASGIMMEGVSAQNEDGSAFELFKRMGNIRATFCGHDHVNDYSGTLDGIELVYGRASGWCGYGYNEVRKGAKLITANCETGSYVWESVFPEGNTWRPESGQRIESVLDEPWMKDPESNAA